MMRTMTNTTVTIRILGTISEHRNGEISTLHLVASIKRAAGVIRIFERPRHRNGTYKVGAIILHHEQSERP
jgi:hypothetical protein